MRKAEEHPFFFTWSAQKKAAPLEITGGQGAWFDTKDQGRWLDFGSLSYQANLGHGERRIADAIKRQCDELLLTVPSGLYPGKTALAEALLAKAPPGFSKVFFTLGGAEAVENALKIARLVTGRHKTVSRYRSYHGATMGALALSGDYRRPVLEPAGVGAVHVLDCFESRLSGGGTVVEGGGSAEAVAQTMDLEGARTVAALFVEPVPGQNGCLVPPAGYWDGLRAACDAHGALLVADCVLNGFGRLGTYYGFESLGSAAPDLITVSKGITGGYAPLGAVLVNERVARHFDEQVLYAGLTFYGHPLGVAAGLEALRIYEVDGLLARAQTLGERFGGALAALQDARPSLVPRTRSRGLLGALELAVDDASFAAIVGALGDARLYVHVNKQFRTLVLAPPLVSTETDLAEGFARLERALDLGR
jgi:taurine--2-oxoglutarate transaminase